MVRAPRSALVTPGWVMVNAIVKWVIGSPASLASGTSRADPKTRAPMPKRWMLGSREFRGKFRLLLWRSLRAYARFCLARSAFSRDVWSTVARA